MKACAFTGHRPTRFVFKNNEKHPLCVQIKQALISCIERLYKDGVRDFYTGCALGVDIWAAEAVLNFRASKGHDVNLICTIPYPNHTERWTPTQKERLAQIVSQSQDVITVCEKHSQDAYKKRNYFLVDHTQNLIAVYDRNRSVKSGTKQTVNYSKKRNLKIIYIHPDTAEIIIDTISISKH